MSATPETVEPALVTKPSKVPVIIGWILSVLPCLMLFMSAGMKLTQNPMAVEGMKKDGWPDGVLVPLGVVELLCTLIFLFPRTAPIGAILLTGYLGGAVATHVRQGTPWFLPFLFGVILWLGLFLREPRLRVLIPWRKM